MKNTEITYHETCEGRKICIRDLKNAASKDDIINEFGSYVANEYSSGSPRYLYEGVRLQVFDGDFEFETIVGAHVTFMPTPEQFKKIVRIMHDASKRFKKIRNHYKTTGIKTIIIQE